MQLCHLFDCRVNVLVASFSIATLVLSGCASPGYQRVCDWCDDASQAQLTKDVAECNAIATNQVPDRSERRKTGRIVTSHGSTSCTTSKNGNTTCSTGPTYTYPEEETVDVTDYGARKRVFTECTDAKAKNYRPKVVPPTEVKEHQVASPPKIQQNVQPPLLPDLSKYVGSHASEIFKNLVVQEKFKVLLGSEYDRFQENLSVASRLEFKGNFYFGRGSAAPTQRGIDDSAFAINRETGEVFACVLANETIKCPGVKSQYDLPAPLHDWHKESESSIKRGKLLADMYEIMKTKRLTDKDLASCGFDVDNENVKVTTELLDELILCLRRKKVR